MFTSQNVKTINVVGVGQGHRLNVRWNAAMLDKQRGLEWPAKHLKATVA